MCDTMLLFRLICTASITRERVEIFPKFGFNLNFHKRHNMNLYEAFCLERRNRFSQKKPKTVYWQKL